MNNDSWIDIDKVLGGKKLAYYGSDSGVFCVEIKDEGKRRAFEVMENESDGYRSYLEGVVERNVNDYVFSRRPLAIVEVRTSIGVDEGYDLVDVEDGHVWVEFGTDNTDDYYPYFVYNDHPKAAPTL